MVSTVAITCVNNHLLNRYHGKCLDITPGKVTNNDKYICPICDSRVPIPRDAARPTVGNLDVWQEEISSLPFKPDEENMLRERIKNARDFACYVCPSSDPWIKHIKDYEAIRFYLRKLEGASILLSAETNIFRRKLHELLPVAPERPPVLEAC